ncbi:hypothetical protein L916_11167 [Phytophthora nicotianae]|uniref:PiggyBac transposable element-derived protein domain-containing protein n=1 Tax=Phytophthora nicotianae TaxID=4792 RepID=W2IRU1_PHYNI|nr:hypothetical protein L916_11167 [Phytophthora nicotianae]
MGFNYLETRNIMQKGWCDALIYPKKKRQAQTPRGTFRMDVAKSNPGLIGVMWPDNTIVYILASQVTAESTTVRLQKGVAPVLYHALAWLQNTSITWTALVDMTSYDVEVT